MGLRYAVALAPCRVYKHSVEIVYFLIPVSLIIVALAVGVFFWAVRSGQYDDLEGPAWRILFDDEPMPPGGTQGGDDATPRGSRSASGDRRSPT